MVYQARYIAIPPSPIAIAIPTTRTKPLTVPDYLVVGGLITGGTLVLWGSTVWYIVIGGCIALLSIAVGYITGPDNPTDRRSHAPIDYLINFGLPMFVSYFALFLGTYLSRLIYGDRIMWGHDHGWHLVIVVGRVALALGVAVDLIVGVGMWFGTRYQAVIGPTSNANLLVPIPIDDI